MVHGFSLRSLLSGVPEGNSFTLEGNYSNYRYFTMDGYCFPLGGEATREGAGTLEHHLVSGQDLTNKGRQSKTDGETAGAQRDSCILGRSQQIILGWPTA